MSIFDELKRRNVIRVAIAYAVAAWLIIQIVETLFPVYGLSAAAIRLVVTLLAIGLVPAVILAWAFEMTPEGLKKEKDVDRSQSITPRTGKKLDRVILVVLALALGYFSLDKFVLDPQRDAERVEVATEAAVEKAFAEADEALPDNSIAVLPFENFSGQEEDEYFSDGLSDTVLHQLAQVRDLKVIARNSTFQFKGTNLDVRDIGERLGVANVLEGSVQRYGDQVRVIAQLVRTSDGSHVWSQSFDYKMEDIFALHDAIAIAVVEQMKVSLLPEDMALLDQGGTDVPEAYDLLLQAWGAMFATFSPAVADQVDPNDGYRPMQLLEKALDLDPDYVDAIVAKVFMYNMFAFQTTSMQRMRQYIEQSRPLVDRAMELAPDYSSTWSAKGSVAHRSGNGAEAIAAYRKAIELNPNDANAHQGLAVAIMYEDPLATIEHMRIARELDPENPFKRPIVLALASLGRIDEAVAELESGLTGSTGLDQMILDDLVDVNRLALGRPDEAARWGGKLLAMQPDSIRGVNAMVLTWMSVGDLDRAERWMPPIAMGNDASDQVRVTRIRLDMARGDMAAATDGLHSMGRPPGPMGGFVLRLESTLCIVRNDIECASEATKGFGKALDMAEARGMMLLEWRVTQQLMTAVVAARTGESPAESVQAVIDATRKMPRTAWGASDGAFFADAEAFVLQGKTELALQAMEESLLENGGFIPYDSFLIAADRGVVLSELGGDPRFDDWKTRFQARREAMRERMIAMEESGEIPTPPEESK